MDKHNKKLVEEDICPRCGKEFHCSKSAKCWCYELDIPPETMENLQREYENCLCPECLKPYAR